MTLQQLRYVCAIADADLNVSRAAERLFTSQPGISKQLMLLEAELGVQLFQRNGKHLTAMTPVGKKILERSRVLLQQAESIQRTAAEALDESRGSLNIATTHTQSRYILPPVISRFVQKYPNISLHMQQGTPLQIAELAARGEADFAIATEALERFDNLIVLPCFRWNRAVLVPKDHPLTLVKKLTLKHLAEYPLVTYVHGFTGRAKLDQAFLDQGLQPNVVFTAADADVINTYVGLGIGVGIIASMAVQQGADSKLVALDAAHLFEWSTTSIAFQRDSFLRGFMYEFITLFAPHLTRVQVEAFVAAKNAGERAALAATLKLPEFHLPQ